MASAQRSYGPFAKGLHWIVFILLTAQYADGAIMPHIGRKTTDQGWVAWHLSIGAAILLFVLLRLVWRLASPVAPPAIPVWQRRLALVTHGLLYLLVLTMVFLGWVSANYRGWTVAIFGIVPLPPLAAKGAPWAHHTGGLHDRLVYVLAAVILFHIAGALYHRFIARDGVLERMLWTRES